MLAGCMIALCESLLYAQRSGLDPKKMIEAVKGGGADNKSIDLYSDRILKRDF